MAATLKPVSPTTRRILTVATIAAMAALMAAAVVFDEETEFGSPNDLVFSLLLGLNLGPGLVVASLFALFQSAKPHNGKLVPIALAGLAFGSAMTWLFFIETTELPDFWPY